MRDNSPSYEPTADMHRLDVLGAVCDNCHDPEPVHQTHDGFILCAKCKKEFEP